MVAPVVVNHVGDDCVISEKTAIVYLAEADEFGAGVNSIIVDPYLGVGDADSHCVVYVLAALPIASLAHYYAVLGERSVFILFSISTLIYFIEEF
ncbi:MAG: hypothetical protein FWG88_11045 [Oscillospiraceae bacterium]|nr:hypothetical protein [Oscillospiraceae bacterium]